MATERTFSSGVLWAYVQAFAARGITTTTFLIIGAMVGPEEYGLFALVASLLAISEMICEQVISQTIVQLQVENNHVLSAIFYLGLLFGVLISGLFILIAFNANALFSTEAAQPLILVAAICPVLISISVVPIGLIRREMDFKTLTKRTIFANGISSLLGLTLVYFGYGAKGLVAQSICYYAIGVVVLWKSCEWRPITPIYNGSQRIGKLILTNIGAKLLDFTETRGVELIIGAVAGVHALGIYAFANKIVQTIFQTLASPVIEVVFSRAAKGESKIKSSLEGGHIIISLIPVVGLVFLVLSAEPLLSLIYNHKWDDSAIPLSILAVAYALRTYLYSYGIVLQATGFATASIFVTIIRAFICICVLLLVLIYLKMPAYAGFAYLLSGVLVFPIQIYVAKNLLNIDISFLLRILKNTVIAFLISSIPLVVINLFLRDLSFYLWTSLFISVASTFVFFLLLLRVNSGFIKSFLESSSNTYRNSVFRKMCAIYERIS